MAQEKDPKRRKLIIDTAKRLFAQGGFHASGVSLIAREAGIPVGSLYTYFSNKEEILTTIIEEGWQEFQEVLMTAMSGEPDPARRMNLLLDRFLPLLFADAELISILFSEGARYGNYTDKLNTLAGLIVQVVSPLVQGENDPEGPAFSPEDARLALLVFLLGTLDTLRLSRGAGLEVKPEDLVNFMRRVLARTFPTLR